MNHIIIQAGGKGTRVERFTGNKPKALLSIHGKPLIMHILDRFPEANITVIADYKADVLEKYLNTFANRQLDIIRASEKGTASGIADAVERIPDGEPFLLIWCDLYFDDTIIPPDVDVKNENHIGLSRDFVCRWSFSEGEVKEEPSSNEGIAGVFIFKDKQQISSIPTSGEFVRHLRDKGIRLTPFFLDGASEVGTYDVYMRAVDSQETGRPFNKVTITENVVVKEPRDSQGEKLAQDEQGWYKVAQSERWPFVPEVKSYNPLIIERIDGIPLWAASFSDEHKLELLNIIVRNLKTIHSTESVSIENVRENNYEAIIGKTKRRLDSVAPVIPHIEEEEIIINGQKCINFYKQWDKLEAIADKHLDASEYSLIHGDSTFSNTLYDELNDKLYFIDPRGYYGKVKLYGDPDYDWAKLYYSIVGNYDQFNRKNFALKFSPSSVNIEVHSQGWEKLEPDFFSKSGADPLKIRFLHAIIWLSLASYAWDDYDSLCGAFYRGTYLMQKLYEETS